MTGAPLASRGAAIADAVVKLLEKHTGYGRGYVSIHIPPRGGKLAKVDPDTDVRGMMTTLRIEASKEAIAMEGIENITTALSIAAIAAAPFTGGASLAILLPVGAIGAIPSAYRLADRGASGTLRMDLGAAMDLVNVIGGVAGLGQVGAVARYTRVYRALLVAGHGADGLGMILAGAQFIEAASNIDPNAPPGVRRAMLMELVGQQLMTLGMMVGTSLARRGEAIRAKQGGAGGDAHLNLKRAPADLHEKFKTQAGTDAPIFEDPNLKGNSVDVRYDIDGYGLVRDVRVMMASGANPEVVLKHAGTVKTLRRFSGLQGLLRNLLDRITTLIGRDKAKVGSKAWAANFELEKLPDIMRHYQEQVATGKMSAAEAEAKIADLEQQIKKHEAALGDLDVAGPGKISVGDTNADAKAAGYPRWRVTTMCATPAGVPARAPTRKRRRPQEGEQGRRRQAQVETVPLTAGQAPDQRRHRGGADQARRRPRRPQLRDPQRRRRPHPHRRPGQRPRRLHRQLKARGEWDGFLAATADLKNTAATSPRPARPPRSSCPSTGWRRKPLVSRQQRPFIDQVLKDLGLMTASGEYTSAQARALFTIWTPPRSPRSSASRTRRAARRPAPTAPPWSTTPSPSTRRT